MGFARESSICAAARLRTSPGPTWTEILTFHAVNSSSDNRAITNTVNTVAENTPARGNKATQPAPRQLTVGIGLIVNADRVLFVKRHSPGIPEYDQKWELPGGKIELGEAVEAAIEREVWEEAGVRVECSQLLPFSYIRAIQTPNQALHVIVLCADCVLSKGIPLTTETPPESRLTPTWISVNEIPYDQVIPGSKEFLLWRLHTLYPQSIPPDANLYEMTLQAINKVENKFRRYRVVLSFHPGSSDPYEVVREWGRIGRPLSRRSERFRRMDQALESAQALVAARQAHGYSVTFVQENHPLRSWLQDRGVPMADEISTDRPEQASLFETDEGERTS